MVASYYNNCVDMVLQILAAGCGASWPPYVLHKYKYILLFLFILGMLMQIWVPKVVLNEHNF